MEKPKTKPKEQAKVKQLPTLKEKEDELDSLLSAEEQAAYDRLEKQGMSDQGIVSPEQLKEFGKDVYKGAKAGAKKVAEKVSSMVEKVKEKMK